MSVDWKRARKHREVSSGVTFDAVQFTMNARFLLKDNNSVNGTQVNGYEIEQTYLLKHNDVIQLGTVMLKFQDEAKVEGKNWRELLQNHPALAGHSESLEQHFDGLSTSTLDMVPEGGAPHLSTPTPAPPLPNFLDIPANSIQSISWQPSSAPTTSNHTSDEYATDGENSSSSIPVLQSTFPRVGSVFYDRISTLAPTSPASTFASIPLTTGDISAPTNSIPTTSLIPTTTLSGSAHLSLQVVENTSMSVIAPSANGNEKHFSLVTILPSEQKYEETITVQAELSGDEDTFGDFQPASAIHNVELLRHDYEKLRFVYEISKLGLTDTNNIMDRTLELLFAAIPADRGVVMLVDGKTGMLTIDKIKIRRGKGVENSEILLSYTILKRVMMTKQCLITSDAFEDPLLSKSDSIARGNIRSVICVPLIAHNEVCIYGWCGFWCGVRVNTLPHPTI